MLMILVTKLLIESQTFWMTPGTVLGFLVGFSVGPIKASSIHLPM